MQPAIVRGVADGEGIGTIGCEQCEQRAPANTECLERTCIAEDRATQRVAGHVSMKITQHGFVRPYSKLVE